MNVKMPRKIQQEILINPDQFSMYVWFGKNENSPCGTAACIGGWAIHLSRWFSSTLERTARKLGGRDHSDRAKKVLGLSSDAGVRLLSLKGWPLVFASAYRESILVGDYVGCAQVASARIEHFIKTEGKE